MSAGTILIAEDSLTVRAVLTRLLREHDLAVVEASDGLQALELAQAEAPDVIVTDLEMPRLPGLELLSRIKADEELCDTPVLILTGDPSRAASVIEYGAHDYVTKPFEPEELLARVNAALRVKRLQDELRAANVELERLACTDVLTQSYNRRFLDAHLEKAISRASRHGRPVAIAMIDVDHFKAVNDEHGHHAGDAALIGVARRLRERLRNEDLLGRWGGEEFMVVAGDTGAEGIAAFAEDLRAHVCAQPIRALGHEIDVTVSIGWAVWAGETAVELVHRADRAMYAAKAAGRNVVRGGQSGRW